ncbi:MAG: hypothetical protein DRP75_00225 [Candidatus Omnitrophota bacterium]|nr:MAG: hypothetical protein DRP75_00225 [Candidatus Omnitrophota bacterium]
MIPFNSKKFSLEYAQASFEFAIFFPLFVFMIILIIQFGKILLLKQRVEMSAFRAALYAAKPANLGASEEEIRKEILRFFPPDEQSSVVIENLHREIKQTAQGETIDYAELSVRAQTRLFSGIPFSPIWEKVEQRSRKRVEMIVERIKEAIDNGEIKDSLAIRDTLQKLESCCDSYAQGIYTACAFHKIIYDPRVPFSRE